MDVVTRLKDLVREVPDFPQPGILFKDLTPVLLDPELCYDIVNEIIARLSGMQIDAVAAIEARGFLFGILIAQKLGVPFIPIRKAGKLPYKTVAFQYSLEYGFSTVEMHEDALQPDWRVLVHDDLLATGGTAAAAASLILGQNGKVAGFSFLMSLDDLKGADVLIGFSKYVDVLVHY